MIAAEIVMAASLTTVGIDAERFGGVLVLAHGDELGAEPAVLDQPHDDQSEAATSASTIQ